MDNVKDTPLISTKETMQSVNVPVLKSHIPSLDGIRGIAILLVLIQHCVGSYENKGWLLKKIWGFAEAGYCGVDLFFCLSGFLITGILLELKGRKRPLVTFYIRRTLRIFPLYYVTLLFLFIVIPSFFRISDNYQNFLNFQWWHWAYVPNFLILFKIQNATLFTSHFWSLAVEEQYYLFWPFVILFVKKEYLKYICLIAVFAALIFRIMVFVLGQGHSPAYVLPFARMDSLVAGALIAIAIRDVDLWQLFLKNARKLLLSALLVYIAIFIYQGSFRRDPLMMTLGFSSLAIMFSVLIGYSASGKYKLLGRFLENPFFRFFGKYSYAMYVFHPFIISGIKNYIPSLFSFKNNYLIDTASLTGSTILLITLTAIAGLVSWYCFESHILKLKNYFNS